MRATTIFGLFIAIGMCHSPGQTQEFTLTTTQANTVSHRSSIDMPGLTGNPLAIIVATPVGNTALLNPHPIGAWYYSGKWHIINSDQTRMPIGAQYYVQFFTEPGPKQFMHTVTPQNLGSEGTYIDNPALNKNPQARVKILQNYAPDVRTPYSLNRHEEKVSYSTAAGRWYIANSNGEPILKGTVYNVVIDPSSPPSAPVGNPGTPPGGQGGAEVKDRVKPPQPPATSGGATGGAPGATSPPQPPTRPPTAAEIKEKLDKANEKLNEISKGVTNPGGGASANPVGGTPATGSVSGTKVMTAFDVKTHGLRFGNSFENPVFGPPINFTTKGLCGGNSYTVLDYFLAGVEIPKQNYKPAHSSPLHAYLSQRQQTSLLENLLKWGAYHVNPFGTKNLEIFNWGLREQLAVLRTYIDRGVPVPLGLKWTGGDIAGKDHQVLAIGYDMGNYKGDVGANIEDLKIFLYEPNYPGQLITMVPKPNELEFYYVEHPDVRYRSYFVDDKYRAMSPPDIPTPVEFQDQVKDGFVHALNFEFQTGSVGLSRSLHVDLKIRFADGTEQYYPNISQNGEWLRNYTETVEVALTTPKQMKEIRVIEINTSSGHTGGIVVWELDRVIIKAIGGGFSTYFVMKDPPEPPNTFKFIGIPLMLFPK